MIEISTRYATCTALAWTIGLTTLGCGGKSSTAPSPTTSGTLVVSVQQLSAASASVTVGGPSSYAVTFAATDTLIGLAAGAYAVANAHATSTDPIVTAFFDSTITGSPTTVSIGNTARMAVTFAILPGTGGLWVASGQSGHPVAAEYTSVQLTTGGAPIVSLSISGTNEVFDASGNLWVSDSSGNTIVEYAAAQLGSSGTPTARVTLTSSALNGPVGLAFDRIGDLWVANYNGNTLVEFTPAQLAAGGAVTPALVVTSGSLSGPARMSFDVYGNLWVPNAVTSTVVAFTASALDSGGARSPMVTISSSGGSLAVPRGLAFDQQGDLWVSNAAGNTIVAYNNGQLIAGGSIAPFETLVVPSAHGSPTAIAFDNSGDLWAISTASSSVIEYAAQQITGGGSSGPGVTLAVASGATSLAFNPAPDGLPLVAFRAARRTSHRTPSSSRR